MKISEIYRVCSNSELDKILLDKEKLSKLSEENLRELVDKKIYELFRKLNLSEDEYIVLKNMPLKEFIEYYNNLCKKHDEEDDSNSNLATTWELVDPNI